MGTLPPPMTRAKAIPTPRRVEERFTHPRLAGVYLHAVGWGDPTPGPPLILLHGAGANVSWWDHLALPLARRHHVVALDFRGHGDSDYPGERMPGAFADDLAGLLAHLGDPPAVLIGHSLGAHVALEHAAAGAGARAVVLIEPSRGAKPSQRRAARLALTLRRSYVSRERAIERFRFLPAASHAAESLRRSIAERSIGVEPDGRFAFKFDARWFTGSGSGQPDLSAVRAPVLLLRGAASPLLTETGALELAAELPDCRLVTIPEAGHHAHLDQPDAVLGAIEAFLSELGLPAQQH